MVLAAGLGSRLKPLTDHKPKGLIEINGKPLIQYAIEHLMFYGVNEIIINLHYKGEQIKSFIESKQAFGIHIEFSDESDELLDTGGGLVQAKGFFGNKPFFLYASDVITNFRLDEMMSFHAKNNAKATLAVKKRTTSRSLLFNKDMQLSGWKNHQTGEEITSRNSGPTQAYGFSGIHCLSPNIFNLFPGDKAFSITKAYLEIAKTERILGFAHNTSPWYEFGRIDRLNETETEMINSGFKL